MINPNEDQNNLEVGTWRHFVIIGSISLLGTAANYFLNEAIIHGKAGPSSALVETQSLWMLFLEVVIIGKYPSEM